MSSPSSSSRAGSHRNSGSSSISALVSTLVPCIVVAGLLVGAFLRLRVKLKRVYAPRTYHDAFYEDEKTPSAGASILGWLGKFKGISDDYVLNHHSLDAYLYIRFLKMLILMAFVGAILTWPVLFPVNATGHGGESGLDILSGINNRDTRHNTHAGTDTLTPPSNAPPKRSLFQCIFSSHTLSASQISASLIPRFREPVPAYTKHEVLEACLHPALAQRQEVIWLARDPAGVSKNEVAELREGPGSYGIEVTDAGAVMNEKGQVEWDDASVRQAPLWERSIVY